MTLNSSSISFSEREDVGSSRIRSLASIEIAFATSTSCCMPTLRLPAERVRVDVDPDLLENLSRRSGHGAPVIESESVPLLTAQEHVFGDGRVGDETQLLMNDADPGAHRFEGMSEIDFLAVEYDGAGIALENAADDIDERGLARSILSDKRVHFARSDVEVHGFEHFVREETL